MVRLLEIKKCLYEIFPLFDTDNSGSIEMNEFICSDGLADTIIATIDYM